MKAKFLKRLLAFGLCATMALGTLVGCGDNSQDNANSSNEEVELTIWAPVMGVGAVTNFADNEAWQQVQENLGIKLNFIHPTAGQELEEFNLMIASGEYPDIICNGWSGDGLYNGGLDKYIDDGVLIRLNELIDEYAPDYKKAMETIVSEEEQKDFYTDEGNIAEFYAISPYEEWSYVGPVIRKDWLEQLNMEEPETIEEYEAMLKAFKDELGAKAPLIIANPTSGIEESAGVFVSTYGIGPGFYQENGEVKYGPIQPEFKEYLELMNRWYEMGLIDQDFPTRDASQMQRMYTTGESGMIVGSPDTVGAWMDGITDVTVGDYPVLNSGDRVEYRLKTYQVRPPFAFAITTACKNPEAAVKFLNYGYTEEGYMLYNYGIEGETYNRTGETITYNGIEYPAIEYTDKMLNNEEYSIVDCIYAYKMHIGPFIRFEHEGNPTIDMDNAEMRQKLTDGAGYSLNLPAISLNGDEGIEYSRIYGQVKTYQDTAVLQFIMGVRSLDEFDQYVEDMKDLEIETAMSYVQAAYDRYQAR